MKMGSRETCLASVAHNVDKNIPDGYFHMPRTSGEIPHEDRAASTWFMSHSGF